VLCCVVLCCVVLCCVVLCCVVLCCVVLCPLPGRRVLALDGCVVRLLVWWWCCCGRLHPRPGSPLARALGGPAFLGTTEDAWLTPLHQHELARERLQARFGLGAASQMYVAVWRWCDVGVTLVRRWCEVSGVEWLGCVGGRWRALTTTDMCVLPLSMNVILALMCVRGDGAGVV